MASRELNQDTPRTETRFSTPYVFPLLCGSISYVRYFESSSHVIASTSGCSRFSKSTQHKARYSKCEFVQAVDSEGRGFQPECGSRARETSRLLSVPVHRPRIPHPLSPHVTRHSVSRVGPTRRSRSAYIVSSGLYIQCEVVSNVSTTIDIAYTVKSGESPQRLKITHSERYA